MKVSPNYHGISQIQEKVGKEMKLTPGKKEEVPNKLYNAPFKVIIFSELGRHKTAFTERYLINRFDSEKSLSMGVEFWIKNLVVGKYKVKLDIWALRSEAS